MLELNRYLQRFGISGWHDPNKGMTKTEDANPWIDMAKRAGRVGSGRVRVGSIGSRVKTGHWSKRVIFKRVNRVAGQTGRGLSRVASRVKLTRIFQKFFYFYFLSRCNLPIVYEFF